MLSPDRTRLEVWGDPIAHSRSPELHAAAYGVLGVEWSYGRRRVDEASFADELAALGPEHRGLSLTLPLKAAAFAASVAHDRRAELTGAVNTLLLGDGGPRGFNTDVGGLAAALREAGIADVESVRIVGAGATATSALLAADEIGARRVEVIARRLDAAAPLVRLGREIGIQVTAARLGSAPVGDAEVTIATLPGDAFVPEAVADALAASGGPLYDVVYGQWPTRLATAWERAGARAVNGLGMLLHQAMLQVRVFVTGSPDDTLPREDDIRAAMRRTIVGD